MVTVAGPLTCQKAEMVVGRDSENRELASHPAGRQAAHSSDGSGGAPPQLRVLENVKGGG